MELVESSLLQALILTKNEEPNIRRTLDKLTWLEKICVLDSYSTDSTIEILEQYPNVEIQYRSFDTFANQCNFGVSLLETEWVLSLDADYILTDSFIKETTSFVLDEKSDKVAYFARFKFLVFGHELADNNTTPRAVLFKKSYGSYFDDGHAHRLRITGEVGSYQSCILHDDRKSLSVWLSNQDKYSIRECEKLSEEKDEIQVSFTTIMRKSKIFAPFLVFLYCLFGKRLIFDGWYGWHYTLQRTMVEILLALRLIEKEKFKD